MCAADLGLGGTAACGGMARRGVGAVEPSAPAQKRARNNGVDGERGVPSPAALQLLEERMEEELAAVLGLLKKAELLSRNTCKVPAAGKEEERFLAAKSRPVEQDPGKAARKRKTPPSEPAPAPAEAARKSEQPEKPQDQRATATPPPRETSMSHLLAEAAEARARRRREEIALERERFRQELVEVERAALPGETISPRDLQELGIVAGREYAVTPTRRQAQRRSHAVARAATTVIATNLP